MNGYIGLEKVLDDSNIITVQTKEYGSIEVIPVDTITDIELTDVQPVKHGRWELTNNPSFRKCSECGAWWGKEFTTNNYVNYCPKCGAKMLNE